MYKIVTLFLIISQCSDATAQLKTSPDVFLLPAHTHLSELAWRDSIYLLRSFQYGRITFATGYSPDDTVLMNFDLYFAEMALIARNGDTTHLKRTREPKLISIGDHLFLQDYKVGYIEIIKQLPVSLGVLNAMNTIQMQYVSGNRDGNIYGMDTRGTPSVYDRYYRKEKQYYFVDRDNKVHKASRVTVLKLFRKNKDEIDVYLRENRIDFEDENDLVKLLLFCHEQERENQN